MKGWMIGVCALMGASASQAEQVREPYAKVGYWEITAEKHSFCVMKSGYPGKVADEDEALMIAYNAQQKMTLLSWTPRKPKFPALADTLDFDLSFLKGKSLSESWGSRPFHIEKSADTTSFIAVFKGPADSDRILRDVASHEALVLFFGPGMLTSLPLKASDAVAKLRQCSSQLVIKEVPDRSEN